MTPSGYYGLTLLHEGIELHARSQPAAIAVDDGKVSLTYAELNANADRIAWLLRSLECGPNDPVGVLIGNSADAIAAILGVLKAGACYVPLNPEFPAKKLSDIVAAVEPKAVITTASYTNILEVVIAASLPGQRTVLFLDEIPGASKISGAHLLGPEDIRMASPRPVVRQLEDDLAYVMFTSGTTGRPKGVMVTHRNAMNLVRWAVDFFGIAPGDRMSGHSAISFDLSVLDMFGPLMAGATACPLTSLGERMMAARVIKSRRITIWFSVPSVITQLRKTRQLSRESIGDSLRLSMFCGEALTVDAARAWKDALSGVPVYNLYGPTEAAIACSWHEVSLSDGQSRVPIGVPCPNVELMVLKQDSDDIADPGEIGRLMIGGSQLSPGYWNDPVQTERVFRQHPAKSAIGARIYETGDLAFVSENGEFYCVGRSDSQIKFQGYRIELSEIESALLSLSGVVEASAVLLEEAEPMIVAVVAATDVNVAPASLREGCQRLLPAYMIPARFLVLDELPKNTNGKIDRKACAMKFKEAS